MRDTVVLNNGDTRFVSFVFWSGTYIVRYTRRSAVVNTDDIIKRTTKLLAQPDYPIGRPEKTIDEIMAAFPVDYEIVSTDVVDIENIIEYLDNYLDEEED